MRPENKIRSYPPGGRPRRDDIAPDRVRELREHGLSFRQIARRMQCGYGTVRRAAGITRQIGAREVSQNPTADVL